MKKNEIYVRYLLACRCLIILKGTFYKYGNNKNEYIKYDR